MTTIRIFIFALAVLSTAYVLRVIADYSSPAQPIHAVAARESDVPAVAQSAADPSLR
jgi:hypothetical protein